MPKGRGSNEARRNHRLATNGRTKQGTQGGSLFSQLVPILELQVEKIPWRKRMGRKLKDLWFGVEASVAPKQAEKRVARHFHDLQQTDRQTGSSADVRRVTQRRQNR